MRTFVIFLVGLALTSCSTPLPSESFRQPSSSASSVGTSEEVIDFSNEGSPKTTDSLEVAHEPMLTIPTAITEIKSILLGDAGSGTVREKNPPTLTVFMDYGCEFCREEALTIRPVLLSTFVAPHLLNIEIVFSPRSPQGSLHAAAALCAAESAFFEIMDSYLLLNPNADSASIAKIATSHGVKPSAWKYCMSSQTISSSHTAPDGSAIERLPAFSLGEDHWIGVETEKVVKERIKEFLKSK